MIIVDVLGEIAARLPLFLVILAGAAMLAMLFSRGVISRYLCGLVLVQVSFTVNVAVMLFLAVIGRLRSVEFLHFIGIQVLITFSVFWVYRIVLRRRAELLTKIGRLRMTTAAVCISVFMSALVLLNTLVVPDGGGSRIEYMVSPWFSYLRIPISIIHPVGWFVAVYLFDTKKYAISLLLTCTLVLYSVSGGSKAGFVFSALAALLFYRDLKATRLKFSRAAVGSALCLLGGAALVALNRLSVTVGDVFIRFVYFAEATIMVYLVDDPTEACRGVSHFAALHRGIARLFGDASANNIDTLFGFALSAIHYGANTFTGPNASVPAYVRCNFSGGLLMLGIAAILVYAAAVLGFIEIVIRRGDAITVVLLPFIVSSLNSFPQDYNMGMSDLTAIAILTIAFFVVSRGAYRRALNPLGIISRIGARREKKVGEFSEALATRRQV